MTLGVSWKDYMANVGRGGGLQKISEKVRLRKMGFMGHILRNFDLGDYPVIFWKPA